MIAWMAQKMGRVLPDVLCGITLKGLGVADLPQGLIFYEFFPPVFDFRKVGWETSCSPPQPNGSDSLSGILRNWLDHRFFLAVELLEREISVFSSIHNKLRTVVESDIEVNAKGKKVVYFYYNVEQVYSTVELTYFLNIYLFFFFCNRLLCLF
jgi:hypothetical protein